MKLRKILTATMATVLVASSLMTGCAQKIDSSAVVATLGEKEISMGLANFMAQYEAVSYDSYFLASFGPDMWGQDVFGDGGTMQDSVKGNVMDTIQIGYLLEMHMEEYGVEISEEELSKIDSVAEEFMSENTDKAIKTLGATKEYVAEKLRIDLIQSKMEDAIKAKADTNVSDDEAAMKTFSYMKVDTTGYEDSEGNTVEYTAEELDALAIEAQQVAEQAVEDFDGASESSGYSIETHSFGADEDNSSIPVEVTDAADGLKEGEVSDLIEGSDGNYYIVRLDSEFDEEATEKKKESIISTRQSELYTEVTDGYKEEVEFEINETEWAKVNFDKLYSVYKEPATETESVISTEN